MSTLWWIAAGYSALYLGFVAAERRNLTKVAPALLLACAVASASPLGAAALAFCALGDAFLLSKDRFFLHGLGAFLVGHALFIPAFLQHATAPMSMPLVVGLVGVTGGVLAVLVPKLQGALRIAVPIYALALGSMVVAAGMLSPLACAGAVIFVVSDSVLSITRFVRDFRGSELVVMSTYYGAILTLSAALTS